MRKKDNDSRCYMGNLLRDNKKKKKKNHEPTNDKKKIPLERTTIMCKDLHSSSPPILHKLLDQAPSHFSYMPLSFGTYLESTPSWIRPHLEA